VMTALAGVVHDCQRAAGRLFTPPTFDEKPARPLPDWSDLHRELKRLAVTLLLLWEEYRAEHADGYGYSRFCDLYRHWCKTISPTMRQTHVAGEKLFVDFAVYCTWPQALCFVWALALNEM